MLIKVSICFVDILDEIIHWAIAKVDDAIIMSMAKK